MTTKAVALAFALVLAMQNLSAWGIRGHTLANLAAVERLPPEDLGFLKQQKAYIGHLGIVPDTWRSIAEPFLRISEEPNHSWYTEAFGFIPKLPRSRTEFILRVYDEYLRISRADPDRAKLLNIRYTGLEAYSTIEGFERMKAGMRLYRQVSDPHLLGRFGSIAKWYEGISPEFREDGQIKQMLIADIAFYMGWTGHYAADSAMPLHDSIHHDGWVGDNSRGYTRDPQIHGRFEDDYVNLIETSEADVLQFVPKTPRHLADPWQAVLQHSLDARNYVEDVYRVDLRGCFRNKEDLEARKLVYQRIAAGAAFLRDLSYTAWLDSASPVRQVKTTEELENPNNPHYNPATGSAPAPDK